MTRKNEKEKRTKEEEEVEEKGEQEESGTAASVMLFSGVSHTCVIMRLR